MNEYLANPLAGSGSIDAANDAKVKELTQQLEQEKLMKHTMALGWMAQLENKNKQI